MNQSRLRACALAMIVLACVAERSESRQLTYAKGQNVVAVFDGWERNPDGTFRMVFSYYNRNYEEVLDIPIGPNNNIEPGGPDQGQPTHFLPARRKFVFSVKVPKNWDPTKRLVWTLTVRGKTEKANAFLLREWEINNQVRAQNGDGSGVGGGNAEEYNEAPQISVGPPSSITLPDAAALTAFVKDDGLPKPRAPLSPPTAGRSSAAALPGVPVDPGTAISGTASTPAVARLPQLRVNWVMYRGPAGASVTFVPERSSVADGKALTTASFSQPGEYTIRGYADDGAVTAPADIVVTVAPAK